MDGWESRLALLKAKRGQAPASQKARAVPSSLAMRSSSASHDNRAPAAGAGAHRPSRPLDGLLRRTASDSPSWRQLEADAPRPRLRAPGRVNDRHDSGGTGRVAVEGRSPAVAESVERSSPQAQDRCSPCSPCSSPDAEEQSAARGPDKVSGHGWEAVEGISPATRRYGAITTGAGARQGTWWFPTDLDSPFAAGDKRGRLSINLCYSKSSKAVLTLLANAMGWANREDSRAPSSIYWAVAPEEVEEMLVLHKPNQASCRVGTAAETSRNCASCFRGLHEHSHAYHAYLHMLIMHIACFIMHICIKLQRHGDGW